MRYRGTPSEIAALEKPVLEFLSEHSETDGEGTWPAKALEAYRASPSGDPRITDAHFQHLFDWACRTGRPCRRWLWRFGSVSTMRYPWRTSNRPSSFCSPGLPSNNGKMRNPMWRKSGEKDSLKTRESNPCSSTLSALYCCQRRNFEVPGGFTDECGRRDADSIGHRSAEGVATIRCVRPTIRSQCHGRRKLSSPTRIVCALGTSCRMSGRAADAPVMP
jgi:hypothetical protein